MRRARPSLNFRRIRVLDAEGLTTQRIANRLTKEGVPTLDGEPRWKARDVFAFLVPNAEWDPSMYKQP